MGPITWAGLALANDPQPRRIYHPPACTFMDSMNEEEKGRISTMITNLFRSSIPEMVIGGRLWPLAYCLMATYLKDYEDADRLLRYAQTLARLDLLYLLIKDSLICNRI